MAAKKKKARSTSRKVSPKKVAKPTTTHKPEHKPVQHAQRSNNHIGLGRAVLGLVLNVIIPGLGSLVSRRYFAGAWQLVLFIVAFVLTQPLPNVAVIVWLGTLIWAIVTSIIAIKNAV